MYQWLYGSMCKRPWDSECKGYKHQVYHLQKMCRCRCEIDANCESDEKYYARKVKWALLKLNEEGKSIKIWRACAACKIEEEDIKRCLPELRKMTAPELVALLERDLD